MGEVLERPLAPARHRLDVDAYYRMAEAGILERGARVELIDGDIIDMPAIGSPHAAVTNRLSRLLVRAVGDATALVSVQSPLRLDAYNEPEPDLLLLRPRDDDYRGSHPSSADVLLLVEVSDSSLAFDRGTKLALYARFEVPEVWIIDLAGAAIEVFRKPRQDTYAARERRTSGVLAPLLVPGLAIDIATLVA